MLDMNAASREHWTIPVILWDLQDPVLCVSRSILGLFCFTLGLL
jgi:hypothetical protein